MPGGRKTRDGSDYREDARALGAAIRELREARGLTREAVATRSGISVSTQQKIEVGPVVEPGYFTIVALCQAMGVSMSVLDDLCRQKAGLSTTPEGSYRPRTGRSPHPT